MSRHAHPLRPADLIGLISFDGDVTENQAIPRRRLGHPNGPPHAVGAALSQWLRRDHHTWVDMHGRHVDGIATARAIHDDDGAWEIEALVEAPPSKRRPHDGVIRRLLEQAVAAAQEARVHAVLLRIRPEAPAHTDAIRAGFRVAYGERLWHADEPLAPPPVAAAPTGGSGESHLPAIRPLGEADRHAEYLLYQRAIPPAGRQHLALTFEEWEATSDRRWMGRPGAAFGIETDGQLRASIRWGRPSRAPRTIHAEVLTDPMLGGIGGAAAAALLRQVATASGPHDAWSVMHPEVDTGSAAACDAQDGASSETYLLLSARSARTLRVPEPSRSGVTIPTGG